MTKQVRFEGTTNYRAHARVRVYFDGGATLETMDLDSARAMLSELEQAIAEAECLAAAHHGQ
jgi:hypothetical protein